jgi:hypothetical protein
MSAPRFLACGLHYWTRQSFASTGRSLAACAVRRYSLSCPRDQPRGSDIAAVPAMCAICCVLSRNRTSIRNKLNLKVRGF